MPPRVFLVAGVLFAVAAYATEARAQLSSSRSPGVASMKVEGRLVKIEGRYYVIKDRQGKELYLLISKDTELAGALKIGDQVEVWTSPIEHAIAIRGGNTDSDALPVETASHTFNGRLMAIEGKYYVVRGADGKELRLLVNQDTELSGEFRPGDQIEVFTSPVEHAVAIKAAE